ncbi:MAG TPA: substrate-binding domain-containing protein [Ktedonobacteraceae bacterium]|nr:substrate-binding domain-containing protein [Ktedonobacteraceae bacterium]
MNKAMRNGHYTLGVLLGLRTPFYLSILKGVQAAAEGCEVSLCVEAPAQFDATLQASLVNTLLASKIDALIVAPCDGQVLVEPLYRAHKAGVPVITVDAFLGDGDYNNGPVTFPLAYIGSDNRQGGRIAGELLIKAIGGSGKVCIQSLQPGVSATDLREAGCQEVLATAGTAIDLLGINFDGGSIPRSKEQMLATLEQHPDLAGVVGTGGDYSSRGVAQAVTEAGKKGSVKIVRFDASEQAEEEIRGGVADVIIAQRPFVMGRIACEYALKALQGQPEELAKHVDTGFLIIDRHNIDTPESQAAIYRA